MPHEIVAEGGKLRFIADDKPVLAIGTMRVDVTVSQRVDVTKDLFQDEQDNTVFPPKP